MLLPCALGEFYSGDGRLGKRFVMVLPCQLSNVLLPFWIILCRPLRGLRVCLHLYPQLALWATCMTPASLALEFIHFEEILFRQEFLGGSVSCLNLLQAKKNLQSRDSKCPITSASIAVVGASNSTCRGISISSAVRMREARRVASSECPPRSRKKWS
jgi:hypothetical protein